MQRLDALITQLVSVQGPQAHWQPTHCGTLPIKIDTEANWFHDGTRVTRQELIKLWPVYFVLSMKTASHLSMRAII
ncbi:DUF1285 domain-containing protein [Pseudoalteromonas xiamenensis]